MSGSDQPEEGEVLGGALTSKGSNEGRSIQENVVIVWRRAPEAFARAAAVSDDVRFQGNPSSSSLEGKSRRLARNDVWNLLRQPMTNVRTFSDTLRFERGSLAALSPWSA